jgi:hypothetical protein
MKKVDSRIKVTGNAWAWAPQKLTPDFIRQADQAHDFFSFHSYTMNGKNNSQADIRAKAPKILGSLSKVSALPELKGKEIWLDEWNMFGSYRDDAETKHIASATAALYDLIVYQTLAASSTTATICAWNECDNAYGKIGTDYKVRESGKLMAAMNAYFKGDLVSSTVSEENKAITMVVKNKNGLAVAIGNLQEEPLAIHFNLPSSWIGKSLVQKIRDEKNNETTQSLDLQSSQVIEAGRVAIFLIGK